MIQVLRLLLRRALIFALVAGLAYFTVFQLFPYIDDRLPSLIAVLATYLIMAYAVIPAFIRVFRLFERPNHIPTSAMTGDGWPSDPVNVAILAHSEKDFVWAMQKAGWHKADEKTPRSALKIMWSVIANKPYLNAPFSNLYLFGRKQDIGFQIPVGNSPRRRHHIRFWKVTHQSVLANGQTSHEHNGFWHTLFAKFWHKEQTLWVGACLYDSGPIAILWRNGQINHKNHPDADYEREFLLQTLQDANTVKSVESIPSGAPYRKRGQNIGLTIVSDGLVKLCELKRQLLPPLKKDG
jgi:hypothetical protein